MNNKIKKYVYKKFTEKKNPYKTYHQANWTWTDIFNKINKLKINNNFKYIKVISNKYNINYNTLKFKYNKWEKNELKNINNENRGGSNKIFTNEEEKELFVYIKDEYINKSLPLSNEDLKIIAKSKFKLIKKNKNTVFNASNGWCNRFKHKWNLSSVTPKISRIATHNYTQEELNNFINNCINSLHEVGCNYFFNLDETFIKNINIIQKTIKIKNESKPNIKINGNDKEGFTLILTISASGKMLKPIVIAKGKTKRSLKKFNLNEQIIGTYSNNGWSNKGIIKIALMEINKITKGKKSVLLLDQFPAHTNEFIVNLANKLNIKFIYVPKGYTHLYQPLDVTINGILKEKTKKSWKTEKIKYPNKKITVEDGIKYFLSAQNDIKKETIVNSFMTSCFNKKYILL